MFFVMPLELPLIQITPERTFRIHGTGKHSCTRNCGANLKKYTSHYNRQLTNFKVLLV